MKQLAVIIVAGLTLAGCSQYYPPPRHNDAVTHGAVVGGIAGGLIGGVATGTLTGAAVGAGVGAGIGAAAAAHHQRYPAY